MSPVVLPSLTGTTAEACLVEAGDWFRQPERVLDEVKALLRHIHDRTKEEVALIVSAIAMVLAEDGSVLLLHRTPADRSYPDLYCFPGGQKDDDDRDLRATAKRETREESGLLCDIDRAHGMYFAPLPRRKRVYEIHGFSTLPRRIANDDVQLSIEHDAYILTTPASALEQDSSGMLPLAGEVTRNFLRRLLANEE